MTPLIQLKQTTSLFLLGFGFSWFWLSPAVQAVSPAPDGCYPNFTTAEGCDALKFLTAGVGNTGLGWRSLFSNSSGNFNTGVGVGALVLNNADSNTAVGAAALLLNTTGTQNVAVGTGAFVHNDSGSGNNAVGAFALSNNTDGFTNNAVGNSALLDNIHGHDNTAIGDLALSHNDSTGSGLGNHNTAVGSGALFTNTDGDSNTAVGFHALLSNTTGSNNIAIGVGALANQTGGDLNTAVGSNAGSGVVTAKGVICIGADVGGVDVSNTTWIGNVYGVTTQNGTTAPVIVSADGQLGTVASSERFKRDVATMDEASEAILSLRPVTFHYKTDTQSAPQFGLIAEEVAKVNPALVLPDKEGKPYTVRYDAVNAMLLNEFLKEHSTVQQLKSIVAKQEAIVTRQQKQIEALTAGLQKVNAQLEVSKPASRVAENNQ